jgi:dTDP-4-amino-4,6-dideoxygalactose transaminase
VGPSAPGEVPFLDLRAGTEELRPEIDAAIRAVLDSGQFVLGPQLATFEEEFAHESGAAHCVGVGNGFGALELALRALGVGPGDDVLVPSNTYIATWLAITAVGARPVGVEPESRSGTLDPERLASALTPKTRAVLPVHLFGHPADMAPILEWAGSRGIKVLSDAAQAHGARYRGLGLGGLGDAVAWSFYPSKNLGALGDGGAVTTDDPAVARRVGQLRNYGSARRDVIVELGQNSRLDDVQAAVLRVKLRHLSAWNDRRTVRAARYLSELGGLPLVLPEPGADTTSAWHLFVVRTPQRDALRAQLARAGVQTAVHYPTPPFAQEAYAGLRLSGDDFPRAMAWADEALSLPIGPHLSEVQQDRVVAAVRDSAAVLGVPAGG